MATSSAAVFSSSSALPEKSSLKHHWITGAIAGQVSGLIMAVVVMLVFTLFLGKGPIYPVQVIGSFVYGDQALKGFHLPAFLMGLVLHQLGPSLFWGLVLGTLMYAFRIHYGPAFVILCIALGLLTQIIDVNLIMPYAMTALHGHDIWAEEVPAFWSWAAHLVFGLGLLVYPKVDRRLNR